MTPEETKQIAEAFLQVFDAGGFLTISVAAFSYLLGACNPWLDRWLESRLSRELPFKASKND